MQRAISILFTLFLVHTAQADASLERCRNQYLAIEKIEQQLKAPRSGAEAARLKTRKRELQTWLRENCPYDTRDYLLD